MKTWIWPVNKRIGVIERVSEHSRRSEVKRDGVWVFGNELTRQISFFQGVRRRIGVRTLQCIGAVRYGLLEHSQHFFFDSDLNWVRKSMEKKLRMKKERKTGKPIKESCTICLFSILPFSSTHVSLYYRLRFLIFPPFCVIGKLMIWDLIYFEKGNLNLSDLVKIVLIVW